MKDTKKEVKFFSVMQWQKEEAYLREQHKAGWRFTKVSGLGGRGNLLRRRIAACDDESCFTWQGVSAYCDFPLLYTPTTFNYWQSH